MGLRDETSASKIKLEEFQDDFSKIDEILEKRIKSGSFDVDEPIFDDELIHAGQQDEEGEKMDAEWDTPVQNDDIKQFAKDLGINFGFSKGFGQQGTLNDLISLTFIKPQPPSNNLPTSIPTAKPIENKLNEIFNSESQLLSHFVSDNFKYLPPNDDSSPPKKPVFPAEIFNPFPNPNPFVNKGFPQFTANPMHNMLSQQNDPIAQFTKYVGEKGNGQVNPPVQPNYQNQIKEKINRDKVSLKTASPESMLQTIFYEYKLDPNLKLFSLFHSKFRFDIDKEVWFYKDPLGIIQGPFKSIIMDLWNLDGYFNSTLQVSWLQNNQFVTIEHFIANPTSLYKLAMIYTSFPIKFDLDEFEDYKRKESLSIELQNEAPNNPNKNQIESIFQMMKSNNMDEPLNQQNLVDHNAKFLENLMEDSTAQKMLETNANILLSSNMNQGNSAVENHINLLAQRFPSLSIAQNSFLPKNPEISQPPQKPEPNPRKKSGKASHTHKAKEMEPPKLTAFELKKMLGIKMAQDHVEEENVVRVLIPEKKRDIVFSGEEFPPL